MKKRFSIDKSVMADAASQKHLITCEIIRRSDVGAGAVTWMLMVNQDVSKQGHPLRIRFQPECQHVYEFQAPNKRHG